MDFISKDVSFIKDEIDNEGVLEEELTEDESEETSACSVMIIISEDEVVKITWNNANSFFGISD